MSNNVSKSETQSESSLAGIAFALLGSLLAVRVLISENYERAGQFFLAGLPSGPTPLTTMSLDWFVLLVSSFVLAIRGPLLRRSGLLVGVALLTAWGLSVWGAGDKRVAWNAGSSLLVTLVAGWALVSVRPPHSWARLLLAALLSVCVVDAIKCLNQYSYEFEATREAWAQRKAELAAGGMDTSTAQIVDYERRLNAAEAFGYQQHPNVAGAILAIAAVGAVGGLLATWGVGGVLPLLCGVCGAVLLLAIWTTGSVAALGLALVGCVLFPVLRVLPGRQLGWLLVGGYALLMVGLLGYGMSQGGLPGASLNFRWQYWTGAAGVIAEAPGTGVGRLNFGSRYLAHKPEAATESVADAHNLWITLLAEMGPLALLGMAFLLGFVVLRLARPAEGEVSRLGVPRVAFLTMLLGVPILHAVFSRTPFSAPGIPLLWLVEVAAAFAIVFVLLQRALVACDSGGARQTLVHAALIAVLVNLVQNLIGFSLMTPGGLAALTVAIVVGLQLAQAQKEAGGFSPLALVLMLIVTVLHGVGVVLPTARSQAAYDALDYAVRVTRDLDGVRGHALALADADSWDPVAPRTAATQLIGLALHPKAPLDMKRALLFEATSLAARSAARDPRDPGASRMLARLAFEQARVAIGIDDARQYLAQAVVFWERTLQGNPTRGRLYLEAARVAARLYGAAPSDENRQRCARWLDRAEALDALRVEPETAKLSEAELLEMVNLRELLARPLATQPASGG